MPVLSSIARAVCRAVRRARLSVDPWKCARRVVGKPAERAEHELDRHGQGAQRAAWRNKTTAIMTARLIDLIDTRKTHRDDKSAVHLDVHSNR
eukprot:8812615-Pyramimonas_sp.AAC.1